MRASLVAALTILLAACSAESSGPGAKNANPRNPRVVVVYDEDVLLTGTTDGATASAAACSPAEEKHVVEVTEALPVKVILRATDGAAPLAGATLHVTSLETKQTWCAMMKDDFALIAPPEAMPRGLYAVSVTAPSAEPQRYEILWKMEI